SARASRGRTWSKARIPPSGRSESMLDLKWVLANFDEVARRLATRGGGIDLEPIKRLGEERRRLLQETESLRAEQNAASGRMKDRARRGGGALPGARASLKALSDRIKAMEEPLGTVEAELEKALLYLPNLPAESVPVGRDESENVVVRSWG